MCGQCDENDGFSGCCECVKKTVLVVWSISENDGFSCCGQCSKMKRLVVVVDVVKMAGLAVVINVMKLMGLVVWSVSYK